MIPPIFLFIFSAKAPAEKNIPVGFTVRADNNLNSLPGLAVKNYVYKEQVRLTLPKKGIMLRETVYRAAQ